ncbi:hypothetical protein Plhal304r1_c004g0016351 [Plasmopara halstedii]
MHRVHALSIHPKSEGQGVTSSTTGKTACSSHHVRWESKSLEELENEAALSSKIRTMRTGPRYTRKEKA